MDNTGSPPPQLDEPTLRAWARTGETLQAEAHPHGSQWHLWIERQGLSYRLTTSSGAPRVFRTLETLARRLMALNIVDLTVNHSPSGTSTHRKRRASDSSEDGFDEEAWDNRFKQQILLALQDDSPGIDYREVSREAQERIRKIGGSHARPKKS